MAEHRTVSAAAELARARERRRQRELDSKSGHDPIQVDPNAPIQFLPPSWAFPSPENDELYRPVLRTDPEIVALAASIREHGVREPIVLTVDGYILSGHRRRCAALVAGVRTVPVRYENVHRINEDGDVDPAFVVLLREYNRQRDKSLDEKLREELITVSPAEAYEALLAHREERSRVDVATMKLGEGRGRAKISKAKRPFLDAVLRVIDDQRAFLPLSDRRIHYALLNDPPLRHASKPGSVYVNDAASYKSLIDLVTRARLAGRIPMDVIADDTRPERTWRVDDDPRAFLRRELDGMFRGYWRNLLRSQPNHIEIVVEKNTAEPIVRTVASEFCIPITSGRGYSSIPPRWRISQRFKRSGKSRLVLLFVTDFDPDGEEIAYSFARSMRDDFGIDALDAIKVALTHEQVTALDLPPNTDAKPSSSRYAAFVSRYGESVYEIEALPPAKLQAIVREAIDSVLDLDAFNAELDAEKSDAAFIEEMRQRAHLALRDIVGIAR